MFSDASNVHSIISYNFTKAQIFSHQKVYDHKPLAIRWASEFILKCCWSSICKHLHDFFGRSDFRSQSTCAWV